MYKFIGALSYTILIAGGSFLVGTVGLITLEACNPIIRQAVIQALQEIEDSENAKEASMEDAISEE